MIEAKPPGGAKAPPGGFLPVEKGKAFSDERVAPRGSAHNGRQWRQLCTFAGQEVFSATRMSRQKTDFISFAAAAAKLCEAFDRGSFLA